eukprot:CAMPEP_0119549240 /NCGR_PEP_ID=MMETSP1352-20130426/2990_1 /TAXON_ID=265584 /ORGANISM="Stauroneis constricta, Strain CCMP1120" /LENGTH=464 /DNA_ID=CAMNT_0007594747 /DNA_START=75 /DNA_END=1469 /DNA_ORIENTATION=-
MSFHTENEDHECKKERTQQQKDRSVALEDLTEYDVLCGRCTTCYNNVGNRRFRLTISMNVPAYRTARRKTEKGIIIASIMESIKASGGSFYRPSSKKGRFIPLSTIKIREKVGHALRDLSVITMGEKKKAGVAKSKAAKRNATRKAKTTSKRKRSSGATSVVTAEDTASSSSSSSSCTSSGTDGEEDGEYSYLEEDRNESSGAIHEEQGAPSHSSRRHDMMAVTQPLPVAVAAPLQEEETSVVVINDHHHHHHSAASARTDPLDFVIDCLMNEDEEHRNSSSSPSFSKMPTTMMSTLASSNDEEQPRLASRKEVHSQPRSKVEEALPLRSSRSSFFLRQPPPSIDPSIFTTDMTSAFSSSSLDDMIFFSEDLDHYAAANMMTTATTTTRSRSSSSSAVTSFVPRGHEDSVQWRCVGDHHGADHDTRRRILVPQGNNDQHEDELRLLIKQTLGEHDDIDLIKACP